MKRWSITPLTAVVLTFVMAGPVDAAASRAAPAGRRRGGEIRRRSWS
jgi:hypothetical protein